MRPVIIAGAAIIVLGIGGYYFQWQRQANVIADNVKTSIEKINAGPEGDGVDFTLGYEDLDVGGFPFGYDITLTNPRATGAFSLQSLTRWLADVTKQEAPFAFIEEDDDTPMQHEWALDGNVTYGIDYLSTSADVALVGAMNGKDTIKGESIAWKSKISDSADGCHIDFRSGALMPMFHTFVFGKKADTIKWMRELDAIHCDMGPQQVVNAADDSPLFTSGGGEFAIDNVNLNPTDMRAHVTLSAKDVETFDTYSQFIRSIGSGRAPSEFTLNPLERHEFVGKQDTSIDAAFVLQRDPTQVQPNDAAKAMGAMPMSDLVHLLVDVKDFSLKNNYWEMKSPFLAEIKRTDQTYEFRIAHDGTNTVSADFDDTARRAVDVMVQDPKMLSQLQAMFGNGGLSSDELSSIIADFIPQLGGFGTIQTLANADGSFASAGIGLPTGSVSVKNLDFITNVYSLKLNGSYETGGQGALNMTCGHCDRLLADAVAYNNRFESGMSRLDPTRPQRILSKQFYETALAFLHSLDTDKDEEQLTITMNSYSDGNYTISGKPAFEVISDAMQRFQPFMQSAQMSAE